MLRASLRSIDEQKSTWTSTDGEQVLICPHHTFKNTDALKTGKPYRFEIEVFPVGHVFREGHQLSLSISRPPLDDPVPYPKGKKGRIKSGSYKYESNQTNGRVTVYRNAEHPSSILLPILPDLRPISKAISPAS